MFPRLLAVTGLSGIFTEGFFLLAQAADPISGGAGWIGAGLLGMVLCWVFFVHLPAKDKQVKELMEKCDTHNAAIADKFVADLKEARATFGNMLTMVATNADKQTQTLATSIVKEIQHARQTGITSQEAYDHVMKGGAVGGNRRGPSNRSSTANPPGGGADQ